MGQRYRVHDQDHRPALFQPGFRLVPARNLLGSTPDFAPSEAPHDYRKPDFVVIAQIRNLATGLNLGLAVAATGKNTTESDRTYAMGLAAIRQAAVFWVGVRGGHCSRSALRSGSPPAAVSLVGTVKTTAWGTG